MFHQGAEAYPPEPSSPSSTNWDSEDSSDEPSLDIAAVVRSNLFRDGELGDSNDLRIALAHQRCNSQLKHHEVTCYRNRHENDARV